MGRSERREAMARLKLMPLNLTSEQAAQYEAAKRQRVRRVALPLPVDAENADSRSTRGRRMRSKCVWKFELRPWSVFLDVPKDAQLLRVGMQGNVSYVWALVDPDAPKVSRMIFTHPTGVPLPPGARDPAYVGSFDTDGGDGPLVFHVFDDGEH